MKSLIVTDSGNELIARVIAGETTISFTRIAVSDCDYSEIDVKQIKDLQQIKQTVPISKISRLDKNMIEVLAAVENRQVEEPYFVYALGIYAKDSNKNEILYGVSLCDENPDYMPAYERKVLSGISYRLDIVVGDSEQVLLDVNPAAVATTLQVEQIENDLIRHTQDREIHVTEEKQKKWDAVEDKVDKLEAAEIKMLGWSVPRVCPIQNEIDGNQFIQKVGRIDLGEMDWTYYSESEHEGLRGGKLENSKAISNNGYIGNIYTSVYETSSPDNVYHHKKDKIISINISGHISVYDSSYTDASTFKQAMQGRYLYYELATPIIKTIDGNEIDQRHSMNLTNQQNNGYLQKNLVDYKSLFSGVVADNVAGTTHTYSNGILKISRIGNMFSGIYVHSNKIATLQRKELIVSFDAKSSVSTMNLRVYICSEGIGAKAGTTENLTTDYKRYSLDIKAGDAGDILVIYGNDVAGDVWIKNLMIAEKYVEDTTYVDPIKSNMELDTCKADKSETTVNLLNPTLQTETQNGVTCTNNGDGTYTLNGVATANTYFAISTNIALSRGKYNILCESNSDAFMTYITKEHDFGFLRYVGVCDITDETDYRYVLHVPSGKKNNSVTVHPMLTTNLNATLDDFVPYTGNTGSLNGDVADVRKDVDNKVSKSSVVNNLITTESGFALDAMQGYTLNKKITDLKKSVSDGKSAVASAITANGVSTASDASFATMAENIGNIFYKRLGKQLTKYFYSRVSATNGSNGAQHIYRNTNTTTDRNWLGHETFFGGSLTDMNGCIIITWLKGTSECAFTIMRLKSNYLGVNNFENLFENNLKYQQMDDGTITLVSKFITPGIEINTLCLACHN